MIKIVVGLPGAGKSYLAAWMIWTEMKKSYKHWQRGTRPKYSVVWTNLEGLKAGSFIKPIDFARLEEVWKWELEQHKKYVQPTVGDVSYWWEEKEGEEEVERELVEGDPLKDWEGTPATPLDATLERMKREGYWNSLWIIDEAHNYFKVCRPWAVRWFAYHRHYNQDIILIVQDLSQLDRRVVRLAAEIIKARNPLIRLGNRFYYKRYAGNYISYKDTNLIEKFSLPRDPFIFSLYESGGYVTPKSVLGKKFLPLLLVGGALFGGFKYLQYKWEGKSKEGKKGEVKRELSHLRRGHRYSYRKRRENPLLTAVQVGDKVEIKGKTVPLSLFLSHYQILYTQQKGPRILLFVRRKDEKSFVAPDDRLDRSKRRNNGTTPNGGRDSYIPWPKYSSPAGK